MALIERQGHRIKSVSTTGPGSAAEIARRCLDQDADAILVAGGDGTINEVANGMVYSNVPLGVLPGGTANVLASEIGLGGDMLAAAKQLNAWIPERVSVGVHRDGMERPRRYFLLMCGAGLDAHIVYHLSAPIKALLGKVAYWVGGFSQLSRKLPEFEMEADGKAYRASFALASRVRNYGGDLDIAPSITLLDDEFEIVLFSGENALRYLGYMMGILRARIEVTPGVTVVRCRSLKLSGISDRRVYTQIDGEYAGTLPVSLEIVPRALTLLLPQSYRLRRPHQWTTSHTR